MASTETSFLHMAYPSRNGARLIPTGIRQPTKEKRPKRNRKEKRGWARRGRVKRYASSFYIALTLAFWASGTYVTLISSWERRVQRMRYSTDHVGKFVINSMGEGDSRQATLLVSSNSDLTVE